MCTIFCAWLRSCSVSRMLYVYHLLCLAEILLSLQNVVCVPSSMPGWDLAQSPECCMCTIFYAWLRSCSVSRMLYVYHLLCLAEILLSLQNVVCVPSSMPGWDLAQSPECCMCTIFCAWLRSCSVSRMLCVYHLLCLAEILLSQDLAQPGLKTMSHWWFLEFMPFFCLFHHH